MKDLKNIEEVYVSKDIRETLKILKKRIRPRLIRRLKTKTKDDVEVIEDIEYIKNVEGSEDIEDNEDI